MGPDIDRLREVASARVGQTINDKYRLDELLGVGAAGAVYRAQNVWAGRPCAVKVFHYEGPQREAALKRFVREAQATNRVQRDGRLHPNVVDAIDVGRDTLHGAIFVVQELLKGETLAEYLDRQPGRRLEAPVALALIRPVVDAMACAHAAGIVHRDLKPENLFLVAGAGTELPTPKVLDFGIAQLQDARLTLENELLGTPHYMSPEAFRSAAGVDARADVWALGAMLYEMVTGASPFAGPGTFLQMFGRIATWHPPSLASAGRLSPQLWTVVRRCLAKDPGARYAHAGALLEALDGAQAPLRVLRVPQGMSAAGLVKALQNPASLPPDALRAELPEGASLPPLGDPAKAWWRVIFHRTSHTASQLLEFLALPELAQVVELHLLGVPLGDEGVKALAQSPRLEWLTGLTLRRVSLGDVGLEALGNAATLNNLTGLDLGDNTPSPAGLASLGKGRELENLRILNLVEATVRDDGAKALAKSPLLARLARLDLTHAGLTAEGAKALSESPHLHDRLVLVLSQNDIASSAVPALHAAFGTKVRKVAF